MVGSLWHPQTGYLATSCRTVRIPTLVYTCPWQSVQDISGRIFQSRQRGFVSPLQGVGTGISSAREFFVSPSYIGGSVISFTRGYLIGPYGWLNPCCGFIAMVGSGSCGVARGHRLAYTTSCRGAKSTHIAVCCCPPGPGVDLPTKITHPDGDWAAKKWVATPSCVRIQINFHNRVGNSRTAVE